MIQREEIIGDCRLILGNCVEIIPALQSVDAIISDVPYGTEAIVGGYGREGRTIQNDTNLDVVDAAFRAAGRTFRAYWVAAFYSPRLTNEFLAINAWMTKRGEIVWNKKAPGLGGRGLRYQHENIALYSVGAVPPLQELFSVISVHRMGQVHPHEKPVELMDRLVGAVPGDTILDPFCGSGSTGIAAVKARRKFIGIEIDEGYFDIACDRIRKAYAQPDFFIEQAKQEQPVQEPLFQDGAA